MARKSTPKSKRSNNPASVEAAATAKRALHATLRNFIRTKGYAWLDNPGVTSIGIGYKVTGGKTTDTIAIQFTVEDKLTPKPWQSRARPSQFRQQSKLTAR